MWNILQCENVFQDHQIGAYFHLEMDIVTSVSALGVNCLRSLLLVWYMMTVPWMTRWPDYVDLSQNQDWSSPL
jgi:hypothetical protein